MILLALCNPSLHLQMSIYSLLPSSPQNDAYAQALSFFFSTLKFPPLSFYQSTSGPLTTSSTEQHYIFSMQSLTSLFMPFFFVWSITCREKTFPLMDMVSIQSQKMSDFAAASAWSLLTTTPQTAWLKSSLSTALAQDRLWLWQARPDLTLLPCSRDE